MPVAEVELQTKSLLAISLVWVAKKHDPSHVAGSLSPEPTFDEIVEAFAVLNRIYALAVDPDSSNRPDGRRLLERDLQLRINRLTMESPLELLGSIPPSYVATGGIPLLVRFFERIFNLPLSVKVDRQRLRSEGEAHEADRAEQKLRLARAEKTLFELHEQASAMSLAPAGAQLIDFDDAVMMTAGRRDEALETVHWKPDKHPDREHHERLRKALRAGAVDIDSTLEYPTDTQRPPPFSICFWRFQGMGG